MTTNNSEELDLLYLFRKVRKIYYDWLLNAFKFFFRFWYVIIIVIAAGYFFGVYLKKSAEVEKETTLLVQINFDAVDYVYDAIDQLQSKIREKDRKSLSELSENLDEVFKVTSLEVTPVLDVKELGTKIDPNDRNVDVFLDQSKYEEDLLLSDMFLSQYKIHKIVLTTEKGVNANVIDYILQFINNNPSFDTVKKIGLYNLENEILDKKESIAQIDSIFVTYGSIEKRLSNPGNVYVNTASNINLPMLIREKVVLVEELNDLEVDLYRSKEGMVSLINKPMFRKKAAIINKSPIFMPFVFLFGLFWVSYIVSLYRRLKEKDNSKS